MGEKYPVYWRPSAITGEDLERYKKDIIEADDCGMEFEFEESADDQETLLEQLRAIRPVGLS